MNKAILAALLTSCTVFALAAPSYAQQYPGILIGENPLSPAQEKKRLADLALADFLEAAGRNLIDSKQYASAESDFRQVVTLDPSQSRALDYALLADAQSAQGKTAESIQTYRTLFYELPSRNNGSFDDKSRAEFYKMLQDDPTRFEHGPGTVAAWMNYIVLLAQTGQWHEAVHFYDRTWHALARGGLELTVHFDPQIPDPKWLQSAAHLAIGADYTEMDLNEKALSEYRQAVQLKPDWAVANYYYGVALQSLNRKTEAQAALQKAATLDPYVKTAVEDALR